MPSNLEQFDFSPYFLLHVLQACITDTNFASKVINILEPNIFRTKEKKFIFTLIRDYYREYKEAPKDHFFELFEEEKKSLSEKSQKIALDVIETIAEINHSNPQYLLNKLHEAVAYIEFEDALVEAAQLHKKRKLGEAKNVILKAIRKPENIKATYYSFLKDQSYVEQRVAGKIYRMRTMIKEFDQLIGGFNPGWLITILGSGKSGKTKSLLEFCVAGVLQGLNGLFISLEMGKSEIDNALDQAVGFLGDKPGEEVDVMEYNKFKKEWRQERKIINTIFDLDLVSKNRKALSRFGGNLIISDQTDGRKFNFYDLESLIDQIEQEEGIIFDFIAVDYLGEMGRTEKNQKKKERIAENASGLKACARSRNLIMFTAMQKNRAGDIADAIEPVWISDLIINIKQSKKEEMLNQCTYYVEEYRHGPKHMGVSLVRDLKRGQISLGKGKDLYMDENETINNSEY